jgi:hypothetical protein
MLFARRCPAEENSGFKAPLQCTVRRMRIRPIGQSLSKPDELSPAIIQRMESKAVLPKTSERERLARLSARQAIIVAAIGALSLVAGAWIQYAVGPRKTAPVIPVATADVAQRQLWIHIIGVEVDHASVQRCRVIAKLDGIYYSFPTRSLWLEIGDDFPMQSLPIPIGHSKHWLGFDLIYQLRDGSISSTGNQAAVTVEQVPFVSESRVHITVPGVDKFVNARVKFAVTDNPIR